MKETLGDYLITIQNGINQHPDFQSGEFAINNGYSVQWIDIGPRLGYWKIFRKIETENNLKIHERIILPEEASQMLPAIAYDEDKDDWNTVISLVCYMDRNGEVIEGKINHLPYNIAAAIVRDIANSF